MKICLILDGTHTKKIGILFIPVFVDNLYQKVMDIYPHSLNTLNSVQPVKPILWNFFGACFVIENW